MPTEAMPLVQSKLHQTQAMPLVQPKLHQTQAMPLVQPKGTPNLAAFRDGVQRNNLLNNTKQGIPNKAKLLGGALLGAGLYSAYKGMQNAGVQHQMSNQYLANRAENINTPYPDFYSKMGNFIDPQQTEQINKALGALQEHLQVKKQMMDLRNVGMHPLTVLGLVGGGAALGHLATKKQDPMDNYYQKFSEAKLANTNFYGTIQKSMTDAVSQELAKRLIGEPIDKVHGLLKKKLMDTPEYDKVYASTIQGDEQLSSANPHVLKNSFNTLKRFAPSLAKDPTTTKSFLTQAMMTNGNIDYATIRALAETEKFIQNSKGKGQQ